MTRFMMHSILNSGLSSCFLTLAILQLDIRLFRNKTGFPFWSLTDDSERQVSRISEFQKLGWLSKNIKNACRFLSFLTTFWWSLISAETGRNGQNHGFLKPSFAYYVNQSIQRYSIFLSFFFFFFLEIHIQDKFWCRITATIISQYTVRTEALNA